VPGQTAGRVVGPLEGAGHLLAHVVAGLGDTLDRRLRSATNLVDRPVLHVLVVQRVRLTDQNGRGTALLRTLRGVQHLLELSDLGLDGSDLRADAVELFVQRTVLDRLVALDGLVLMGIRDRQDLASDLGLLLVELSQLSAKRFQPLGHSGSLLAARERAAASLRG
jgi:hypothetical protein